MKVDCASSIVNEIRIEVVVILERFLTSFEMTKSFILVVIPSGSEEPF